MAYLMHFVASGGLIPVVRTMAIGRLTGFMEDSWRPPGGRGTGP